MEFLLIGDDRRQRCLAEFLQREHRVFAWGQPCAPDAIVLPCPSFDAAGKLRAACPLPAVLKTAKPATTVFCCGGKKNLQGCALPVIDLLEDETVALRNARLTAEATLSAVTEACGDSLYGKRCLIVGYGRIGAYLARLLAALCADCTVVARRPESRALAEGFGFRTASFDNIDLSFFDFVFNTVPAQGFSCAALAALPPACTWVELASAPGGLPQGDFAFSVLPAGGLPGKYIPNAAARVLYAAIERQIGT